MNRDKFASDEKRPAIERPILVGGHAIVSVAAMRKMIDDYEGDNIRGNIISRRVHILRYHEPSESYYVGVGGWARGWWVYREELEADDEQI